MERENKTENNRGKRKKKRARRLKKIILWVLVLAMAGAAVYWIVLPSLEAEATVTYEQYTATRGSISNSMSFSGSISVKNNETLSASSAATVRQIYVSEEEDVKEGQKLMRLSNGETLKASFDGRINEIAVETGDEVSANTALIQVVDFNNMKVSMRVDEYNISDVAVGQTCRVSVTALETQFESKITHINRISASNGSTAYYTVTAELEVTGNVLPGMAVTVTIPQEEAVDAVILSKKALSFDANNSAYVLVDDGTGAMIEKPVTIGVDNDNYVEITGGLAQGDTVYVKTQNTQASSGAAGLLGLLGGAAGGMPEGMPGGMNGGMPDRGDFGGSQGGRSGGGNFGGGMPGGGR